MTKDDIISIAREVWGDGSSKPWSESALLHLERFAALVAAAEREACAALCSEVAAGRDADAIEEAILARGEK
jgi:hypothetical protein